MRTIPSYRFFNGSIVTMDPDRPVAGEVVTHGHTIAWVGRRGDAPARFRRSRPVDLKGRLLLPAFSDAHTHILYYAASFEKVDLHSAPSLRVALRRIRENAAGDKRRTGWITGAGFDVNRWGGVWPAARDLDRAVPKRPAAIYSHDTHSLWVNTVALQRCGIDATTPDPPGGRIVRDAAGRPTGILQENPACQLVTRHIPPPTVARARRLIADVQRVAHRRGVAAVADMGMHDNITLQALADLKSAGRLRLRVWKSIPLVNLDEAIDAGLYSGMGDRWIKIGGVKIFLDGALGSQTAWMLRPYSSNRRNLGVARLREREFSTAVRRAADAGLAVCIHAIGDAAVRCAIDVLVRHRRRLPKLQPARIEHLQLIDPDDLQRLAGTGIVASMQPSHLLTDRDYADRHWGRRSRMVFAFRSLWDHGVPLAFGSDAPIEPLDPLTGIAAAVNRAVPGDRRGSWHPSECLSVWEAVWGFTMGAAVAAGDDQERGMIRDGFLADLVILNDNLFSMPPGRIPAARVSMTFVDGECVYNARH